MNNGKIKFAVINSTSQPPVSAVDRAMRHPVCYWLGLRGPIAQHSEAEHAALEKYAAGKTSLVEIGVADGASALVLATAKAPRGKLALIDPFHLSRVPWLNFQMRAAKRLVQRQKADGVEWVQNFSTETASTWNCAIDFLLLDGDHSEEAVERDWKDWSPHVGSGGLALFHDARIFPGGWPHAGYGPVKFVDRTFRSARHPGWQIVDEVDSLVCVSKL